MKRITKNICFILAIVMVLALPVSAAEDVSPRASYFFAASSTYLWRVSDTKFEVWFDIAAVSTMEELGASVIKVQRSSDGINWTTMQTFTKEIYPHLIAQNTGAHAGCISYTGTPGYYYRAFVTYYAKNSSGIGEAYRYTSSMLL